MLLLIPTVHRSASLALDNSLYVPYLTFTISVKYRKDYLRSRNGVTTHTS